MKVSLGEIIVRAKNTTLHIAFRDLTSAFLISVQFFHSVLSPPQWLKQGSFIAGCGYEEVIRDGGQPPAHFLAWLSVLVDSSLAQWAQIQCSSRAASAECLDNLVQGILLVFGLVVLGMTIASFFVKSYPDTHQNKTLTNNLLNWCYQIPNWCGEGSSVRNTSSRRKWAEQ